VNVPAAHDRCQVDFPSRAKVGGHGFTLIEILLAISLLVLVIGIGGAAFSGWRGMRDIHVARTQIAGAVQQARVDGWRDRGDRIILFRPHGIEVRDASLGFADEGRRIDLADTHFLLIRRPGEREFRVPGEQEWMRLPATGLCEPLAVRIETDQGWVSWVFNPLTAGVEEVESNVE